MMIHGITNLKFNIDLYSEPHCLSLNTEGLIARKFRQVYCQSYILPAKENSNPAWRWLR